MNCLWLVSYTNCWILSRNEVLQGFGFANKITGLAIMHKKIKKILLFKSRFSL